MGMMQSRHVADTEGRGNVFQPLLAAGSTPGLMPQPRAAIAFTQEIEVVPDDEPEQGMDIPRDALGRLVLNLLHAMIPGRLEELQSPRVSGLVCRLRRRVRLTICCTMLAVPIAVWLLVRGVITYIATGMEDCDGALRVWLLGFLFLQLAWPICMPSLTLLLLGWCLGGALLLRAPQGCTKLSSFLVEASAMQTIQAGFLLAAAAAALTARPIVQQIGEMLGHGGTSPDVISKITTLHPANIPAEEECVICLSRDDEEGVAWRELICNHRFHEPCLLEWLTKAHKCPVCRMDLHSSSQINELRREGGESLALRV